MVSGWGPGTPLRVATVDGGTVRCRILRYDLEGFYRVRVEAPGHAQDGRELIVHEDDAALDSAP